MQSRYWRIHYGPEGIPEEAGLVASTFRKALKATQRNGIALNAKVYMLCDIDEEEAFSNIIGLVNVADQVSQDTLLCHMMDTGVKRNDVFRDCQYEALDVTEFERMCVEYADRVKTHCFIIL